MISVSVDLRFLVGVAWENRHGQKQVAAFDGERAAARRLVKRGLLCEVSSIHYGLTKAGEELVDKLDRIALGRLSVGLRLVK